MKIGFSRKKLIKSFSLRSRTARFKDYVSFIGIINTIQSVDKVMDKENSNLGVSDTSHGEGSSHLEISPWRQEPTTTTKVAGSSRRHLRFRKGGGMCPQPLSTQD